MRGGAQMATAVVVTACAVMAWSCGVCGRAIPHRAQTPTGKMTSNAGNVDASANEHRLFERYTANIDRMARTRRNSQVSEYRRRVSVLTKASGQLSGNEDQAKEYLRAAFRQRNGRKLSFDGEAKETTLLVPSSDVSARIFTELVDEQVVDPNALLIALRARRLPLSHGWAPLLRRFTDGQSNYETKVISTKMLYEMGDHGHGCRDLLESIASSGDADALETLLFSADALTGESRPIKTQQNEMLVSKLSAEGAPPEIRVVCARYDLATGKRQQAEEICSDVVSQSYRWLDDPNVGDPGLSPPAEDDQLYRAKVAALDLLFYDIRNQHAFGLVYRKSRQAWTETEHPEQIKGHKLVFSPHGRLEIQYAESLIGGIGRAEQKP